MEMRRWCAALLILAAQGAWSAERAPEAPAAAPAPAAPAAPELEKRIDEARRKLDDAARQLADLHRQMWAKKSGESGKGDRPMLGVLLDDSSGNDGLVLVGVTPGGGAERAGLMAGDRLVALNGVALDGEGSRRPPDRLGSVLHELSAGDSVRVTYVRDGQRREVDVITQPRQAFMMEMLDKQLSPLVELEALAELEALKHLDAMGPAEIAKHVEALGAMGAPLAKRIVVQVPGAIELRNVGPELGRYFGVDAGVVVLEAPDQASGLLPGDVLLSVGGEAVTDADHALELLAASKETIPVTVRRQSRERKLSVDGAALNATQDMQVKSGDRRIVIKIRDRDEEAPKPAAKP